MGSPRSVLAAIAVLCFVIAACPTGSRYRFECFGFAALTVAYCLL